MKAPRPYARPAAPPSSRIAVVCMVAIAFVVIGLGVGHISRRHEVIRLGYDLSAAKRELREVQEENRKLRVERSVLTNPERIRRLAESLGMQQPTEGQVRIVRPDATELADLGAVPR